MKRYVYINFDILPGLYLPVGRPPSSRFQVRLQLFSVFAENRFVSYMNDDDVLLFERQATTIFCPPHGRPGHFVPFSFEESVCVLVT